LIACAQTGTGKTAAFVLPILERLLADAELGPALVLAPTRELAMQIADTVHKLAPKGTTRVALVLGGAGMEPQIRELAAGPDFIIATPGRLIDHLDRGTAKLDRISTLVLDEADRMLDMGFAPQIARILRRVPEERHTMLFSATMPSPKDPGWREILAVGLKDPQRISVDPPRVAAKAEQQLIIVDQADKTMILMELIEAENGGSVLVFTRTKHRADRLAKQLVKLNVSVDRIHGDRSQSSRKRALERFKKGEIQVLVATDIAARGIDVPGVAHVVNYDLPMDPEDYVHRVGRTARASLAGKATSLVMRDERPNLKAVEKLIGEPLPKPIWRSSGPDQTQASPASTDANRRDVRPDGHRSPRPWVKQGRAAGRGRGRSGR
jgi:ATP-dependent RNA helicase RhlE